MQQPSTMSQGAFPGVAIAKIMWYKPSFLCFSKYTPIYHPFLYSFFRFKFLGAETTQSIVTSGIALLLLYANDTVIDKEHNYLQDSAVFFIILHEGEWAWVRFSNDLLTDMKIWNSFAFSLLPYRKAPWNFKKVMASAKFRQLFFLL